jgi:phospholipid/cholesterol/gamma-HCH transport system ATP-binding protein
MSGAPLISYGEVWKRFGPKPIYEGLTLEIRKSEIITIIGGSGTGKSVMLKMLIGLLRPDRGRIFFDGSEVTRLRERELIHVRRRVGMLFQGGALFDSLSVGENVAYGLREHFDLPSAAIQEKVAEKLTMVGLPGIEAMAPADLSGGMKKRVALARAIAVEPEVVLYDEPTTGLDPITASRINQLIQHLNEILHITSVVVTHDMQSAFTISDRIAMLARRRIVAIGSVEEIKASPEAEVQDFIQGTYRGTIADAESQR